ncbi:MAG: hypothetical protein OHK0017_10560 [Patescibacteria group bacterium]
MSELNSLNQENQNLIELNVLEKYFKPIKPHSRAAYKMAAAVQFFQLQLQDKVCADFGANSGGFTAIMLNCGAEKVYAVETGYGLLDWTLRQNQKVICMERTNAMRVSLPEKVDLISIDTSWTKQKNILPNALNNLRDNGIIITLIKPHYEIDNQRDLRQGHVPDELIPRILEKVRTEIESLELKILGECVSPIAGKSGKNIEHLWLLRKNI